MKENETKEPKKDNNLVSKQLDSEEEIELNKINLD